MTVAFFARLFYPHIGGVEKHVMEIGKRLVKKGWSVIVICESDTLQDETINGINIYHIDAGKNEKLKKFKIWKWLWQHRNLIKSADIIHCHDVFYWYIPFRFVYPRKPVYTTFHGYEGFPIKKNAIIVRKISEKLSWGNICIGDFIKKWYGTKPTYISYGAVDRSNYSSEFKTREIKNQSALFFGRLDDQTGILTYIKAFEILRKKYPHFNLLVVGDGKYRTNSNKNIDFVGFQVNPEKYFGQYRFAFISRYLSILEAFAAKRLVFAVYDNPVKKDYLRMAPYREWIIIVNDEKEIAEKVTYYIDHPADEKELVERAYKWVQQQTWEKMTNTYLKLWEITTTLPKIPA
jgi:glycosyltransferase involved in cell wall biosynthesis